jgi:hypothetical protein
MSLTQRIGIGAGVFALVVAVLLLGGQTYRTDSFSAVSQDAHRLDNAKCIIHLFDSGEIREESLFLKTQHPKDTSCGITVFVFNPAYTSFRVTHLSIDVDGTNAVDLTNPPVDAGDDLTFKPYDDKEGFRSEFPHEDPRYANFFLMPGPTMAPLLARPLPVGSRIQVRVSLDILSANTTMLSTNVQTDFVMRREETRVPWAWLLFVKLFRIRF